MSIVIRGMNHYYMPGTPFETMALQDINLTIDEACFTGLIGHTGSGKSTLVQHINGLLLPTSGNIVIDGVDITEKGADLRAIRQKVGLVFQYPEHQLFEETVEKDVAFGPKNMGMEAEALTQCVRHALRLVGLPADEVMQRSPFELSGGQKRRVAIAGVLAMQPKFLILDEPTAGLDPKARHDLLALVRDLHETAGLGVMMATHNMDDIARIAEQIIVMNKGRVAMVDTPAAVFAQAERLEEMGLRVPDSVKLAKELAPLGLTWPEDVFDPQDIARHIARQLTGGGEQC